MPLPAASEPLFLSSLRPLLPGQPMRPTRSPWAFKLAGLDALSFATHGGAVPGLIRGRSWLPSFPSFSWRGVESSLVVASEKYKTDGSVLVLKKASSSYYAHVKQDQTSNHQNTKTPKHQIHNGLPFLLQVRKHDRHQQLVPFVRPPRVHHMPLE
ncbi:hypothetical protein BN1723_003723 [Verticillium longisporum]|uniref:Uncharacterized protein n=1 Tax=Verticillium longisporum TaxID=100787 RepID=A0A0G4M9L3_VERLO|nr:hypothetical protein BN1723_003723 [Verticillium longisporum]